MEGLVENEKAKNKFYKKRRQRIAWCVIGLTSLIGILLWFFISTSSTNDLMGWVLKTIETMDETHSTVAKAIIVTIVSLGIIPVAKCLFKEIFSHFEE